MEIALLGLRLVVGVAFAAHGAQKLFGAFGGGGIGRTARSFERIGLRPGKLHAWAAATTEFLGGLVIALGLVTPLAATALIAVMVAAAVTVGLPNGFFVTTARFSAGASRLITIPLVASATPNAGPPELMAAHKPDRNHLIIPRRRTCKPMTT